jgi:Fe-S-cluster containining protein
MRCSNCGKCCERTEMELSSDDIRRLEGAGYQRDKFSALDNHVIRLMNIGGWCYFYSLAERKCRVYRNRPMGCRLYPIVYSVEEGVIVDALCPMGHTISEQEWRTKGKILGNLLKKIDYERKCK